MKTKKPSDRNYQMAKILFYTKTTYFNAFTAFVNLGKTSKTSPTIP